MDEPLPINPGLGCPERGYAASGLLVRKTPGLVETDRVHGSRLMPEIDVSLPSRVASDVFCLAVTVAVNRRVRVSETLRSNRYSTNNRRPTTKTTSADSIDLLLPSNLIPLEREVFALHALAEFRSTNLAMFVLIADQLICLEIDRRSIYFLSDGQFSWMTGISRMARRSDHSREELYDMALEAARL